MIFNHPLSKIKSEHLKILLLAQLSLTPKKWLLYIILCLFLISLVLVSKRKLQGIFLVQKRCMRLLYG